MAIDDEFDWLMPGVVDEPRKYLKTIEAKIAAGQALTSTEKGLRAVARAALTTEKYQRNLAVAFEKVESTLDRLTEKVKSGQPLSEEEDLYLDDVEKGMKRLLWWRGLSREERDLENEKLFGKVEEEELKDNQKSP